MELLSIWVGNTTWEIALRSKHLSIELNRVKLDWIQIQSQFHQLSFLNSFKKKNSQKMTDRCSQFGSESWREELGRPVSGPCTHSQRNLALRRTFLGKQPASVVLHWGTNQDVVAPLRTDQEAMKSPTAGDLEDCLLNKVRTGTGLSHALTPTPPALPTGIPRACQAASRDTWNTPQEPTTVASKSV